MGEIAEMTLDGTLCAGCGGALDGTSPGYPRYCSKDCQPEGYLTRPARDLFPRSSATIRKALRHNHERREVAQSRKPFGCDQCPKLCRTAEGLAQHKRDKHG